MGWARLRREMEKYQPRFLCFNGKRAAKGFFDVKRVEYGPQEERIGETRVFVAPSTRACVVPTGVGCPEDWAWANCVRHGWVELADRKSRP